MNMNDDRANELLATKIAEAEARIEKLEVEIDAIGQPAASELKRRLEALKVEERALKRNLAEVREGKGAYESRMAKIETLMRHIEREESSVEHEAAFLSQSNPSTMIVAAEAGAKVVNAVTRGVKKIVGDHPFEKSSVFVNHSHETLVKQYGLKDDGEK
ncbi:hypothetical protein ACFQY0_10825 [Haloferula chungangensis]|uniref:Uncharacterized protein n=1 Tax=Haloferula chungangensis TaxID=1048331 RepID=A0ABW2L999_9BACT